MVYLTCPNKRIHWILKMPQKTHSMLHTAFMLSYFESQAPLFGPSDTFTHKCTQCGINN